MQICHFYFVWIQSAAAKARTWSYLRQKQVSVGLSLYKQQVYVTKEAREFLFDGYQDDLIDMAREMARFDPAQFAVPYDRFGWFYQVISHRIPFKFQF